MNKRQWKKWRTKCLGLMQGFGTGADLPLCDPRTWTEMKERSIMPDIEQLRAICPDMVKAVELAEAMPCEPIRMHPTQIMAICARLLELAGDSATWCSVLNDEMIAHQSCRQERDEAIRQIGEEARQRGLLEATVQQLRCGPPPRPSEFCRDCGRALVWAKDSGTLICPNCVYRRMERAETEVERLRAAAKEGE